jgi:hypothetical protein
VRIKDIIREDVSQSELNGLRSLADKLFNQFGIEVEFTKHFFDRANDDRAALIDREGKQDITAIEIAKMFVAEYETLKNPNNKYPKITDVHPGMEANLSDYFSKINIPFAMNKRGKELVMTPKTVMRSKNFHTARGQKNIPVNTKDVNL